MLTTSVEARLQAVDAPIMRQLKEVVLLIKGGMPLGGILSAMLYMISTTARWRNLRFVEPGDRQDFFDFLNCLERQRTARHSYRTKHDATQQIRGRSHEYKTST